MGDETKCLICEGPVSETDDNQICIDCELTSYELSNNKGDDNE